MGKYDEDIIYYLFNYYIDECLLNQKCPKIIESDYLYLSDISIEKYISKTSEIQKNSTNADQAYFEAKSRIYSILSCERTCRLEKKPFENLSEEIQKEEVGLKVKNKKAFWTFLKYSPSNNKITDFEGACGYIKEFHLDFFYVLKTSNKKMANHYHIEKLDKTVYANFHILDGVELFERCLIKKKLLNQYSGY